MRDRRQARALVLSGVVGSGKTSVAVEIAGLLEDRGEAYAVIDLDWLAWFRAPEGSAVTVAEMLESNLLAVRTNLDRAGIDRLVLARDLRSSEDLEAIRRALPDVDVFFVRLEVERDVARARVRRRDRGAQLEEHLEAIDEASSGRPAADAVVPWRLRAAARGRAGGARRRRLDDEQPFGRGQAGGVEK